MFIVIFLIVVLIALVDEQYLYYWMKLKLRQKWKKTLYITLWNVFRATMRHNEKINKLTKVVNLKVIDLFVSVRF